MEIKLFLTQISLEGADSFGVPSRDTLYSLCTVLLEPKFTVI